MSSDLSARQWEQVKDLFTAALDHQPGERTAFLQGICGSDSAVRVEVERLLAEHDQASSFLAQPALGWAQTGGAELAFPPEMIGRTLSHYEIVERLGEGGMGVVYKARDLQLDRLVALKLLPGDMVADPERERKLVREAKAASALNHPNIITIHETGIAEGVSFIVMESVEGETLDRILARRRLSLAEAWKYGVQVADALSAAHAAGIVHLDLKPSNIMVRRDGWIKVLDFGLAKRRPPLSRDKSELPGKEISKTEPGGIFGTVSYMSPEQAEGKSVDSRSDIFSFATVLYEMITGKRPFHGDTPISTLAAILTQKPEPLSKTVDHMPAQLEALLERCFCKEPANRFPYAEDLKVALEELRQGSASAQMVRAKRLWERAAIALAIALVVVTGVVFLETAQKPPAPHKPVSVLVADFDNTTGEPVFDGTFEPMLGIAMEGAPFISAFNRADARKTGTQLKSGATRLDADLARLVAVREGIDVIVAGSIKSDGTGYAVSVNATDAVTGKQIVSRQEKAPSKQRVLAVVGKLAAPVRKALGDVSPESKQLAAAETFSAASLEAAQQYSLGQDFQWSAKWDEAIRAYSKAIELDPTLGRADTGLAVVYYNLGQREKAEPYFTKAMSLIDRMTDRERYRTRGSYFIRAGDIPSAIDEFSRLVAQYPVDSAGLNNLALAYSYRREMGKAVTYARQSFKVYPKSAMRRANVAIFSMYAGDFPAAEVEAQGTIRINPDYVKAYIVRGLAQLAQGKVKEALETYTHVESALSPSSAAIALADLALYQGRLADAIGILDSAIARSRAEHRSAAAAKQLLMLAQAHLLGGHKPEAVKAAGEALTEDQSEEVTIEGARIFAQTGNDTKARALAAPLATKLNKDLQAYSKIIDGEILLEHGDALAAVQQFRQAQALADTWPGRFDLGRAYLAAGAFAQAHAEFTVCQSRRGEATALFLDEVPSYHYYPATLYYLGRVQEQLKSPAAADSYRAFLALKAPDSSESLVVEARRRSGVH